jgi:hypothetical protein
MQETKHLRAIASAASLAHRYPPTAGSLCHECSHHVPGICAALANILEPCLGLKKNRLSTQQRRTADLESYRNHLCSPSTAQGQPLDAGTRPGDVSVDCIQCAWLMQQVALLGSLLVLACGQCSICLSSADRECRELLGQVESCGRLSGALHVGTLVERSAQCEVVVGSDWQLNGSLQR